MLNHSNLVRLVAASAFAVLFSGVVGCVSKEDWLAVKADRDNLAEQLAASDRRAESSRALAEGYRNQLGSISNGRDSGEAMQANYEMQIANLTSERDALGRKYEELVGKIGTGPALPTELTTELSEFAAQNPEFVTFDADRGIVKFKSDVTFNTGDATLTAEAGTAIDRFAQILNSPVARSYELRVAGHTDNVSQFSAATKQKGHKDNWYLSSHRAISVGERLMGQGVTKSRIGVLGFADQRPAAGNESAAGRAQNRRVEVLILPTTVQDRMAEENAMPASSTTETPELDDSGIMK